MSGSLLSLTKVTPVQTILVVCINILSTMIITMSLSFVAYSPETKEWCDWNGKSQSSYVCTKQPENSSISTDDILRLLVSSILSSIYFFLTISVLLIGPLRTWLLNFNSRFNCHMRQKKITLIPPDYSYFESLMRQSEATNRLGMNRN